MSPISRSLLTLASLASLPLVAAAQASSSAQAGELISPEDVAAIGVPVPNLEAIRAEDVEREAAGEAPRFAVPHQVEVTPGTHGTWESLDGDTLLWRLRVQAPGASSINLGFGEYRMPIGGELYLYSPDRTHVVRPFTAQDNEEHGELWTPVVRADELVIEVKLPLAALEDLRLTLTQVGYGYRGFSTSQQQPAASSRSGSCNVDVICPEGDDWRLDIPSVGVISLGGGTFCTGFLVNNVRADQRPYFMTANHCGVRAGNASSLVVYWNYENSTCRTPGSSQSGGPGNGSLSQFNTGSTFRASYGSSDFTLVELDDQPDPSFMVSYAGWDNTGVDASMAIAIHHPRTDEKRISFEYQATTVTSYLGNSVPGAGTHVRVIDWDLGTTEGGSSGSPLFDQNHRVIGQLHGGFASCSSQTSDWYGRFAVSWNGGGTSSSRLKDWLDPDNTGATTTDTLSSAGTRGRNVRYGSEVGGANIGTLNSTTIPTIGQTMTFDLSGFVNSSVGVLFLSGSKAGLPFLGGALLIDLNQVLSSFPVALAAGNGSVSSLVPNDAGLVGTTVHAQAGAADATQSAGFALSNGLSATFGDF